MLVLHENIEPLGEIGVWQITESEEWFLQQFDLHEHEHELLASIKGHRRVEWLASRWLLHYMSGREERGACLKDENGKPYLTDSEFQISLSHSHDVAAVLATPFASGIDIQKLVKKIERIAHKFVSDAEAKHLPTDTIARLHHLHVLWGAKECLYKAHGRRKLDFRKHLHVDPFDYSHNGGNLTAHIRAVNEIEMHFKLNYRMLENEYLLVHGLERDTMQL